MASLAVLITYNLYFDMARLLNKLFHIHAIVAKGSRSFTLGFIPAFLQFAFLPNGTHTLATTTGSSFYHYRIANFFGHFQCLFIGVNHAIATGNTGHSGFFHGGFSSGFITHLVYLLGGGTNKLDAILFANARELRVLRQETIPWMDGICICNFCGSNNAGDVQVRIFAGWRADTNGFICKANVKAVFICLAVNRNRFYAHFSARSDYSQGDFASVGNKYFFKHGLSGKS